MNPPQRLEIDDEQFVMSCIDDGPDIQPYVDVRLDTIPPREGDPDYSESPDLLRTAAAWLVKAADWLEERQGRSS